MSTIPAILKTEYDFGDEEMLKAFSHLRLGPFVQDTQDWIDPDTGVVFPATFDYFAHLSGHRQSDHVDFAVRVRMNHKIIDNETGDILSAYVKSEMVNAVFCLSDFSNCACTAEKPCERHPR